MAPAKAVGNFAKPYLTLLLPDFPHCALSYAFCQLTFGLKSTIPQPLKAVGNISMGTVHQVQAQTGMSVMYIFFSIIIFNQCCSLNLLLRYSGLRPLAVGNFIFSLKNRL